MNINTNDLIKFDDSTLKHLVTLTNETTGMRALKLVLVRMLRIFNLIKITNGEKILNISKKLVSKNYPYLINKEIVEEIFEFCSTTNEEQNASNVHMYL